MLCLNLESLSVICNNKRKKMNLNWYLIGYENESFEKLWQNIVRWIEIWPFIFPEEDFYVHIRMMTAAECAEKTPSYSATYDENGRWLIFNTVSGHQGDNRPGNTEQPLTDYPPYLLWHEMGEWFGSCFLDYDTEHWDQKCHCGGTEMIAGACPQCTGIAMMGKGMSSHCVKCRAGMWRRTGLKVNFVQTPGEYRWFEANFGWRSKIWPYADLNAQMNSVSGYDYEKYRVIEYLGHDLGWFAGQVIEEPKGKIHIYLDRVIGGDGMPERVITFEDPEVVFDPYPLSIKRKGFRRVSPDPAIAGGSVTVYVYTVEVDGKETPRQGTKVFIDGVLLGYTDSDGSITFTA